MGDGLWRDVAFSGGFIVGIARRLFSWSSLVSFRISFFFDYVYLTFDHSFIVIELCIRVVRYDNFFLVF